MGRKRFISLLIIAMFIALVFAALNPQSVQVELAFMQVRLPMGIALVIACAFGLAIGVMMRGAWVAELLSERGRLRRALKAAEAKALELAAAQHRAD
jgi:uncharacterized integral membrane protein